MRKRDGAPEREMCTAGRSDDDLNGLSRAYTEAGERNTDHLVAPQPRVYGPDLKGMLREIASKKLTHVFIEERSSALEICVDEVKFFVRKSKSDRVKFFVAPGALAKSLLSFLFSKKAFESVFAQAIIDMREEHADALASGHLWKARWIVLRDHLNLGLTVAAYFTVTVMKKVTGIWKIIP